VEKWLNRAPSGQGSGAGELVARGSASVRRGAERLAQQMDDWKRTAVQKLQRQRGASGPAGGDGQVSAAAAPQTEMTREQALRTLGLEPGATLSEIEAAYRARARQNGSLNGSENLSRARDVLRGSEGS
jgi:hypothetical protein